MDPSILKVGQKHILSFEGNPTTGYVWELYLPEGLKKLDQSYTSADPNGPPGTGGTEHFTILADKPGAYTVVARYRRPWLPEDQYIKEHKLPIQVK
jgi:inhibitor of cysteine peptidase